jgi:hypothetical protein
MRFDVDAAATPATGAGSINSVSYRSGASHRAEFAPVFKTAPAIDEVCALSLAKGIISRQTPLVGAKPWPLLLLLLECLKRFIVLLPDPAARIANDECGGVCIKRA